MCHMCVPQHNPGSLRGETRKRCLNQSEVISEKFWVGDSFFEVCGVLQSPGVIYCNAECLAPCCISHTVA